MKESETVRGFARVDFDDHYNAHCSIQDSSLATEYYIWLGTNENRMHLTQQQVADMLPYLRRFVKTGSIANDKQGQGGPAMNPIQIAEAVTKIHEAAVALAKATETMPAVTIPEMTVRGLPTPAPVEPQAGQVWVYDGTDTGNPFRAYVLHVLDGRWQPIGLRGAGYWELRRNTAAEAVAGLTFAAHSVAEFYQAELKKRVAELEALCENKPSHKTALRCLRSALHPNEPDILSESQAALSHEMAKLIEPALATAREEGAKAAREERFQASRGATGWWGVWDNKEAQWEFLPAHQQWDELKARAEAARLNAEHAKEKS